MRDYGATPADEVVGNILAQKGSAPLKERVSLWDLLRRPELEIEDYIKAGLVPEYDLDILEQLEVQAKYEGYINKQYEQVQRFEKMESRLIPEQINYENVPGLSNEAKQKLTQFQPMSVGQASRIAGVSPADINVLLIYLEKERRK